ncbi:MAG: DNA internalization-related competence protein ComEC/Rec2, partial [Thermoanaerobacteraceae bacterium]|nr:DNA internalization-related competence protein ComEC/Rec2 [Thermoanaerobacteraceae bacterium]
MYRPFLFVATFFVLGIATGNFIKSVGIYLFTSFIFLLVSIFSQNKKAKAALLAVAILFFGAFYHNFRLERIPGTIVNFAGEEQTLIGIISDAPTLKKERVTYDVKALYIKDGEG